MTRTTVLTEAQQRFVPMRLLGKGGLGEVTLAKDNDIDRTVALKRLLPEIQSPELLWRFAQEIRTVGQLEHPNIAPVHDVGLDDDGRHYFVMRYVEGETLDVLIAKLAAGDPASHARYPFTQRVELFFGVLNAIAYAHAKQIIHRDIKPANIIIGPYGEVVVMDWGIAKRVGVPDPSYDGYESYEAKTEDDELYQTRHGQIVGTPAYMSPEQARGATAEIDLRSDVYSLGVLFYELLTLEHYLPGRTSCVHMISSILGDEHLPARNVTSPHQGTVPAELSWYVEKALARDPAQRYQSVAEMVRVLQVAVSGAFPVQCPITFIKRVGGSGIRFVDRHPAVTIASATTAMALIAFGVVDLVRHFI